jgi:condensation enzyme
MGLFLNVLPFRTDLADCASFRDVVLKTRETFIDAMANELPIGLIEQTFSHYVRSREDRRTSQLLISDTQFQDGGSDLPIAEGATGLGNLELQEEVSHDIPSGTVWYLSPDADGRVYGAMHFNRDEFEESTVVAWSTGLKRILAGVARDPDQDWRQL